MCLLAMASCWCQKLVVVKVVIMLFLNNFLLSAGGGRPLLVDLMVVMRVMERIYIAKEEFRMSLLSSLVPPTQCCGAGPTLTGYGYGSWLREKNLLHKFKEKKIIFEK